MTLVDLGSEKCIPCRMMIPVLRAVERKYAGRAAVVFIDVFEHQDQVQRFGIRSIPTQIFYDRQGREVERHVGYLDQEGIEERLDRLLAR